jgi:hypothetical protein
MAVLGDYQRPPIGRIGFLWPWNVCAFTSSLQWMVHANVASSAIILCCVSALGEMQPFLSSVTQEAEDASLVPVVHRRRRRYHRLIFV